MVLALHYNVLLKDIVHRTLQCKHSHLNGLLSSTICIYIYNNKTFTFTERRQNTNEKTWPSKGKHKYHSPIKER